MSRYLLLILLNLPFVVLGTLSTLTQYKLGRVSVEAFIRHIVFWLLVLLGLIMAEPLYAWLYSHDLTQTEPLSLFDVIQITAIILLLYLTTRLYKRLHTLESRIQDIHQELSIRLSDKKPYK